MENRLVVCVSNEDLLDGKKAVFWNQNGRIDSMDTGDNLIDGDFNFALLAEDSCEPIVKKICAKASAAGQQLAVAVHKGSGKATILKKSVSWCEPFSHEPSYDLLWRDAIGPLVDMLGGSDYTNYERLFNNLWQALVPTPSEQADRLREELLLPLVGLDWLNQMKKSDKAMEAKLESAIENNLKERKFQELCGYLGVQDETKLSNYMKVIREMLETRVVNHDNFEQAAEQLQKAIVDLEKKESEA